MLMGQATSRVFPSDSTTNTSQAPLGRSPSPSRSLKRKRSAHICTQETIVSTLNSDTSQHQVSEGRVMIEKELSNNVLLSRNQRNVLESAVSFVDHISQAHSLTSEDRGLWERKDGIETELTPGEIIHVLSGSMHHVLIWF